MLVAVWFSVKHILTPAHTRTLFSCLYFLYCGDTVFSLWAVNLCSNPDDKLQIYRDNFEKAYMDSTERFYRTQAPAYLQQNGVQNYMKYVS